MRVYPPGRSAKRGATSAKSRWTTSWERSSASASLRAWRSPRLPSVIICSASGLTALAFASVVLIRPCSIRAPARFEYSALRCAESRPSFLPARRWRIATRPRAVRRHVEARLVVVGALTDTRRFDVVRDATHRREDRVDRNDADRVLGPAVQLRRDVAAAAPDRQRHLELALLGQVRDLEVLIQDLELGRRLDVRRLDDAGAALRDVHLDLRRVAVQEADEALEVEDDVGDVLADALERRELVRDPLDLDRGDRGALQRREQHATQRVAERVTEAAVERLDLEDPALLIHFLVDDLRDLEFHQACACCQSVPFYFE